MSHKGKKKYEYMQHYSQKASNMRKYMHGNRPASRRFQVDERRIREWRTKKSDIESVLAARGNKAKQRSNKACVGKDATT